MRKPQFSKVCLCVTTLLFIGTLLFCATRDYSCAVDVTVYLGMLAITGSIELTTIVAYNKNSWVEKVQLIKAGTIKTTAQERYNYNTKMLLFLKENGLTREDLDNVEADSPMDELDNAAVDAFNSSADTFMEEASTEPEVQTVQTTI